MARRQRQKQLILLILTFFCFFKNVLSSCKLHDASWEVGKGPTLNQPSKNDPTKVKVDWSNIIKNARWESYTIMVLKIILRNQLYSKMHVFKIVKL
jgi:hypothetical protein